MVHIPLPSIPSRLKPASRSSTPGSGRLETPSPRPDSVKSLQLPQLALRVLGRNLAAKDRSGTSDPYAVLTLGDYRNTTITILRTLNPVWDTYFDFPLDHKAGSCSLEVICWDKDRFGKDYLGEFGVDLTEVIRGNVSLEENEPIWYTLCSSSRKKSKISGEIQLKFGLIEPTGAALPPEELAARWDIYVQSFLSKSSVEAQLRDVPAMQSVGMVPSDSDDTNLAVNLAQSLTMPDEDESDEADEHEPTLLETEQKKRRRLKLRNIRRKMMPFQLTPTCGSVVGLIFMEIHSITDLPPEKNMTRLSFDMDPFVVVSFGKKTFRTRCLRHTLNPVFNERLICHVYRHEETFKISFRVVDRDKLSGNDFVGEAMLDVQELIQRGPKPNPSTGLYHPQSPNGTPPQHSRQSSSYDGTYNAALESIDPDLYSYDIPIELAKKERHEGKHSPVIHIRAKHVPYPALREQFWRQMLKHYDTDDTETISRVELVTMLDSLGSTLKDRTINHFFTQFGLNPEDEGNEQGPGELTIDQVVACLENQLVSQSSASQTSSLPPTPRGFATPSVQSLSSTKIDPASSTASMRGENSDVPALEITAESASSSSDELSPDDSTVGEHVVFIKECPLCHQPRLQSKSEVDIVTHLALCASQDWKRVDRLVMGDFVTSSQAQRKWYSKVVSRITTGSYKLGANSANILVQDRLTGQIQEERMSVYVRLGIRLLYKGLRSGTMEKKRIRNLLRSLSVKQGKKYDSPSSAREIKNFVAFHQLKVDEVLLPLDQYKTFNEFFYRKLKPGARPCVAPNNTGIAVSPADCRTVVFNKIDRATEIWVKSREFNLERLFGEAYPDQVQCFEGGTMGIFRLAPQDYHRFHVPVDGILGEPKTIEGEFYTVNPMAIRSALDVFGENVRIVVPIDSVSHGRVMVICVGAMMVGSIVITAKAGQKVSRTDELGYFAYGGSTVLLLFQPGMLVFDDDLAENSSQGLETLVRVGMSIGHHPNVESTASENIKSNITKEDLEDASRRIGGAFDPKHAHKGFAMGG
ncbi:Phosphatidylserine decarboxylase proenzyme 3 [Neolecta irregularis DAH-3]|uniref:Phosphatidylserine decarboxylase proenzyme 2 n=1 Tax=Neolecta irregularis (strain DAH-3) TaxID=1198029 RepID=A0A1U7LNL0_NEOID|nr:Phosphatidylserine decarboxylase proenzyme 3 [Neolecta irregularis DAH-3]|eukprot:OLL24111.1 Phosphatidylserine decarboxylase proenzyme 3 [Neolecta irregularis DAH-3]